MPPRVLFLDPEFLLLVGAIHAVAGVVTYIALSNARQESDAAQGLPDGPEFPAAPGPLARLFPAIKIQQRRDAA